MSDNIKYFVTSDLHFRHPNMVELCGRPKDYEKRIIKNWKELVKEDDVVIVLGDITMRDDDVVHDLIIKTLPGRKILVKGNHDKKSFTWYMRNGWTFAADAFRMQRYSIHWLFTHKPEDISHDQHLVNVHGHLHNTGHRPAHLTDRHRLVALEYLEYRPVELVEFVGPSEHPLITESKIFGKAA